MARCSHTNRGRPQLEGAPDLGQEEAQEEEAQQGASEAEEGRDDDGKEASLCELRL